MALFRAMGSFNTGTGAATTTVAVTTTDPDSGTFQPKVVIFWWSGRTETTDAAGGGNIQGGVGWTVSSSSFGAMTFQAEDASGSADCDRRSTTAACISVLSITAAVVGEADLQSFGATGFTLEIITQFTASLRVHYLALGGDDITNAVAGTFQAPSGGTPPLDLDITAVGFQPDVVFLMTGGTNTVLPSIVADIEWSLGIATVDAQAVLAICNDNAATTMNTGGYCRLGQFMITTTNGTTAINEISTLSQFLSNGFRMNFTGTASGGSQCLYLAIKGGRYKIGSVLTQTDTTTDIVVSGMGFSPKAGLVFSACRAEDTSVTTMSDHAAWSIGGFQSATQRGCHATMDVDNVADSLTANAVEHDEVYANFNTADAIEGLMDVKTINSDGVTFIMDDADPVQSFAWYLTFGSTVESVAVTLKQRSYPNMTRGLLRGVA